MPPGRVASFPCFHVSVQEVNCIPVLYDNVGMVLFLQWLWVYEKHTCIKPTWEKITP